MSIDLFSDYFYPLNEEEKTILMHIMHPFPFKSNTEFNHRIIIVDNTRGNQNLYNIHSKFTQEC